VEDLTGVSELGEVYLELAELDLESEEAISRFVRRFGVLGVAHERFALFKRMPGFEKYVLPELARAWPGKTLGQTLDDYLEHRGESANSLLVETLSEFRFGARCVRDLVTAARISESDEQVRWEWESIPRQALTAERSRVASWGVTRDRAGEARGIFLVGLLNDGLGPFHPQVVYSSASPGAQFEDAPLYAVCCLELFNHLGERAGYRRCANESCGRLFVRQRGRAEHGQYRVRGVVKYCSNLCARAQAQREYRRRQGAA
jgi:hypothetical protein